MADSMLRPASFRGFIGISSQDITPPPGIHSGNWGASSHEASQGFHRPLRATAVAISTSRDDAPLILVALDHLEFGDLVRDVIDWVTSGVESAPGIDRDRAMVVCSHTHSSPWLGRDQVEREGGDLLEPYAATLKETVGLLAGEAAARREESILTWRTGSCDLATNRDLPDPDDSDGRYISGFNPDHAADDTVVVGRIARVSDGSISGVLVNYACHPTVLGPDNTLVGPDFIGGMRELVESYVDAPCVFLQGASGELAPAYQYVSSLELADQQGRRLGHAALATLEGMLPPGMELTYAGVRESGAPLGMWTPSAFDPDTSLYAKRVEMSFPVKPLPSISDLEEAIDHAAATWQTKRLIRLRGMARSMAGVREHQVPAWVWRLGNSVLVGHPNEAYSDLQTRLRGMYPDLTIAVMNLANDADVVAYLSPESMAAKDLYQVWQSPYGAGALEILIKECGEAIAELMSR